MENIVSAPSSGVPAASGATTAVSGGAAVANGQFGMLVANEISSHAAPSSKSGKSSAGKGDSLAAPALMALLMQYGSLLGILPSQADATQQGTAAQSGDTAQQGNITDTAPTSALASSASSASMTLLQQLAAQQDGQTETFSQIASSLLANMAQTTDADQATAGQTAQGAQGIAALLATLKGTGRQTAGVIQMPGAAQMAAASQATQLPEQTSNTPQGTQSGTLALLEIRQMFASLIEGGQDAADVSQAPVAAQAAAATVLTSAAIPAPVSTEKESNPSILGPAQALQAALDAIEPDADAAAQQGGAQPDAGKSGSGKNLAALPGKAGDAAGKAEPTPAGKDKTVDFSGALRAAHTTVTHSTVAAATESKQATAVSKSSAEAFDSIVDKITAMQNSSQKEMEISLKPDFLGKVVIKLSMDGGNLVAKIAASNPKVQEAFQSQAAALQNSLSDQGLKNVRIVVTSSAVPDTSLQQQSENRGHSHREQEKRNNPVIVDAAAGTSAGQPLTAYEQVYRTGSVNRLA